VTLGFYPAHAWGGPVKIVYQNCRELVNRGHEVTVYCSNLLNKKEKIHPETIVQTINGIRVVYLDTVNFRWWPGTLGPFWFPDLPAFLRKEIHSFDVVHLNGYRSPIMLVTARAARSAGVPIATQPHGTLAVRTNTIILKRLYDILLGRMELNGIRALIALQESEKNRAIERHVPEDIIHIIPNGINPHEVEELPQKGRFRQKYAVSINEKVILFVGRINKIKGIDMLLMAFSQLDLPNIRLMIAGGDDGHLAEVKDLIKKLGLGSKVTLTGLLTGDEVKAALQDSDLFVLPSRYDAFPTSVMEACLLGVPMVVTDRCEIASMIKDQVAEVVPFNEQAFSFAMKRLLTDHHRYQLYKRNCPKMIADIFSINVTVDRLESVYNRIRTHTT
jgi:glycosyltransferase involved in cell wall biosynthesis